MSSPQKIDLFGLGFDRVTMRSAVERCVTWCLESREPHTVLTANAAILCMKRRDVSLDDACRSADLVVPDGASVVWAARLAGTPLPERIPGVDLMVELLEAAAAKRLGVFFLGGRREVVTRLVEICERDHPSLVVAGARDGYFKESEQASVIEVIERSGAHMLFVGMPSPFKEVFCQRNRASLGVPVMVGVGGSFDVLAGFIRRAPVAIQRMGLEWFWRLCMEPRKLWKRYLVTNTEFVWLTARLVFERRFGWHGSREIGS